MADCLSEKIAECLSFVKKDRVTDAAKFVKRICFAALGIVTLAFYACGRQGRKDNLSEGGPAQILLFNGTGTSPNDVAAFETILTKQQLNYATINSSQLNAMSNLQLHKSRLLIIPGGDFIEMGKSLKPAAAAKIHNAVGNGLNYLGVCAGGFLAGRSRYYKGFNLTSGVSFGFYSAENKGIRKAAVAITSPGRPALQQYWEDGPQLSGWGAVAGKYPDGTPAIAEGQFGKGWVILSGIHAEAPEYWRGGMNFNTSTEEDNAYAVTLIKAALNRQLLPHY